MKNFIIITIVLFVITNLVSCKDKEKIKSSKPSVLNTVVMQPATHQGRLPSTQPENPANSAIIYWDVSIPVAGYVTPESSHLVSFLRRQGLLYTFSKYGINETYISEVGDSISNPYRVGNFLMLLKGSKYADTETHLSALFKHPSFNQYPVRVIFTDGVQSSTQGYTGSNVYAVVETAIKVLKENHLHFWIVSIMTDYWHPVEGKQRFSERNNNWVDNKSGLAPFYFWIITKDENLGNNLVNDIVRELKKEIKDSPDDKLKVAKIYPINTRFSFPLDTKDANGKHKITNEKDGAALYNEIFENGMWVQKISCSKDKKIAIPLNDPIVCNDNDCLSKNWKISTVSTVENKRWLQIVDNKNINIDCSLVPKKEWWELSSSSPTDKVIIKAEDITPQANSEWWGEWNTEDDYTNPSKTLYLSRFIEEMSKTSKELVMIEVARR